MYILLLLFFFLCSSFFQSCETNASSQIGDRSTSDVVVRLRTQEGRDEWLYCHSNVLVEQCKYFADRLSENWPTCQILDSRNCVEVNCQESDFDHHVNVLRFLYAATDGTVDDTCHGVRNALGVLQVAVELGCPKIITSCVSYLEAVPWEESEEEEILRIIPRMGPQAQPIIARLQPVNPSAVVGIFLSAIRFATSSPPLSMNDLKSSAQEQLEYMITEDDDAPLLIADDEIKSELKECVKKLFGRFSHVLEALLSDCAESMTLEGQLQLFQSHLSDLIWACQMLTKMDILRDFINSWVDISDKIVKAVEQANPTALLVVIKLKVIEVTAKVLDAVGYGTLTLPTAKRLCLVKVWLPFVRVTKPLIDSTANKDEDTLALKVDGDLWQTLESTFVSIILALPSGDQAEILTEWLDNEHMQYPDLTEAFEVWCYRSKVAKRRLALTKGSLV